MGKKRNEHVATAAQSYDDAFKAYQAIINPSIKKQGFASIGKQSASEFMGYNTNIGQSKYDENLSWNAEIDEEDITGSLNEHRARSQSGLTQMAALPLRAATKAATEMLKLVPVVYGVGKAMFEDNETSTLDDIFNNEGVKALDELNEKINTDLLPVYAKKSVTEGNLWDNISSTSFWATEGADGIGFMASMFAPGMILQKLALGSKLIGGLSKIGKGARMAESAEGSVNVLKGLGWSGRAIDSKVAVLANSLLEAGSEAKGVGDDLQGKHDDIVSGFMKKGMSKEEAEALFKEQRDNAMKGDFFTQLPMLLGTGSIMHKAIFGKVADKVEKTVEQTLKQRAGSTVTQWGKAFLSEGLIEEGGQSALENYFTKSASKGLLKGHIYDDVNLGDLTKEYINTVSSTDGLKAVLLGGVMGGPFMSMEARKEHLHGLKNTNYILNNVNSAIDDYNKISENDIYLKDPSDPSKYIYEKDSEGHDTTTKKIDRAKALEVAKAYRNTEADDLLYDEAVKNDDTDLQKFIQNRSILKLIAPAVQNGELGLKILKEQLDSYSKLTDIESRDKDSRGKENIRNFTESILNKATHLQEQNEKFKDFANDVIDFKDERSTKETSEDFINHLNSKYIEVKSLQYDVENELKSLNQKRDNILEELGLDKSLNIEDELSTNKEKDSALLKATNDKIRIANKSLNKYKQDVHDLWNNKSLLAGSFKQFLDEKEKDKVETSTENVIKYEEIDAQIKNASTSDELDKIDYQNNPVYKKQIEAKKLELDTIEIEKKKLAQDEIDSAKLQSETESSEKLNEVKDLSKSKKVGTTIEDPFTGKQSTIESVGKNKITLKDNETQKTISYNFQEDINDGVSADDIDVIKYNAVSGGTTHTDHKTVGYDKNNESFKDYVMEPRDKTGDIVTFEIDDLNPSEESKKAIEIVKEGKDLVKNRQLLIDFLPINFIYNKGKAKSWSAFKSPNSIKFRTNIVDLLIQGNKLEDLSTVVTNQESASFNTEFKDEKPVKNNPLEIDYVKSLSPKNPENKVTLYHVNKKGDLVIVSNNKEPLQTNITTDLQSQKGQIFIVIKNPKGVNVPVKLNFSKLNNVKASSLAKIYGDVLKDQSIRGKSINNLSSINEISKVLESEIKLLGGNVNTITVNQLIESLVHEDSTNDKAIRFTPDIEGKTFITFNDKLFSENEIDKLGEELQQKYHNVITISSDSSFNDNLNFQNPIYLKYLFDNGIVSTNLSITNGSFKQFTDTKNPNTKTNKGSELWLSSTIEGKKVAKSKVSDSNIISDINDKKADIEKRRQEELDKNAKERATYKTQTKQTKFTKSNEKEIIADGEQTIVVYAAPENSEKLTGNTVVENGSLFVSNNGVGEIVINEHGEYGIKTSLGTQWFNDRVGALVALKKGGYKVAKEIERKTFPLEETINDKYDAELNSLTNNNVSNLTIISKKDLITSKKKDYDKLIGKILSRRKEGEDKIKGPDYLLNSDGYFIRGEEVTYTDEGIIFEDGSLESYDSVKEFISDTVSENYNKMVKIENKPEIIRKSENKSVSLQQNIKIDNKMDIPGTKDSNDYKDAFNKLKVEGDNLIKKEGFEKTLNIAKNNLELFKSKNPALVPTYEKIIKEAEDQLNKLAEDIKKQQKC